METKSPIDRHAVDQQRLRDSTPKGVHKRKPMDWRQGMIMSIVLGPPRAKEWLVNRSRFR